jgi:hypothetical protein
LVATKMSEGLLAGPCATATTAGEPPVVRLIRSASIFWICLPCLSVTENKSYSLCFIETIYYLDPA